MFTDCPDCRRQFRIRADQISAAGGEVRCGFCGRQFNAVGRLRDAPLPAPAPAPLPDPEFELPPAPPPPVRAHTARRAVAIPAELQPETDSPTPPRSGIWSAAALLLVLVAATQLAWFHRDILLLRFPALRPWVDELCARTGCEVVEFRDLAAIGLVNRDVRVHPLYEGALLVNATIRNAAPRAQPWPRVQLVLFDTDGRALAQRSFGPDEYLDAGVDRRAGMPPESSAHLVLELAGAMDGAVSFEFGFL
ncbi:MAG TPA: zinc-ribbon and DUF3426 domain-containing protein [Gammaproteobacteria bacterium]|jgi:predicted Zn finger-like uncharacterized protein